jgi:pimeloyl-ACP methyl ester carboxylesterase
LERWFTPEFRAKHIETVAKIRGWVLANNPENYAKHRQVLATGVVELIRPDPALTAPCLVVTCEHDSGSTPQMSQAIAAEIPNSELLILPKLQHLGLIEQPSLFSAAINKFLTRTLHPARQ